MQFKSYTTYEICSNGVLHFFFMFLPVVTLFNPHVPNCQIDSYNPSNYFMFTSEAISLSSTNINHK